MNRDEFMKRLEYLLSDIPDEDKADALDYYRDYLEEAGDAEEEAIREFGSPERIAAIIWTDLQGNMEDGGEFTERGFEDERFRDPNFQVAKRLDLPETAEAYEENCGDGSREYGGRRNARENGDTCDSSGKKKGDWSVWKVLLLVFAILAASPVLLGIGGGVLGILTGILGIAAAVIVLLAVLTIVFLIGGVIACVFGIVSALADGLGGLVISGVGLIMLAFGLAGLAASVWFYGKLIPWAFRGCIDAINRLVHRRVKRI